MPRHERSRGRRAPFREPRPRLLVVCGAEQTEKSYFVGLRDSHQQLAVDVTFVERARSPDQVVGYARDHCDYRDFDQAWCVVDVDRFETEGKKVTAACAAAAKAGIRIAVSNPCFEYWLLLHHTDSSPIYGNCDHVAGRLRSYLRHYDKAKLRFSDFANGIEAAIERARRRDPSGVDFKINPSTGVWMVVDLMMGQRSGVSR